MKNKLSVIFLLVCIVLYLIYKKFDKSNISVLYIGDNSMYNIISSQFDKYSLEKYTFNNITYKNINFLINNNDYKIIKDKSFYLTQYIKKADVIILNANNFEYSIKCKKNKRVLNEYNNNIYNNISKLVDSIKKINNSRIFVIGNKCDNFSNDVNNNFIYINVEDVKNIEKNITKNINN